MNIIDTVSQTQTMAKRSLIKRSLKIRWNEVWPRGREINSMSNNFDNQWKNLKSLLRHKTQEAQIVKIINIGFSTFYKTQIKFSLRWQL